MLLLLQQNLGFAWGVSTYVPPTPTPTPTVTPAGKSRKHRYFVEVDGETFEAESASHALAILDRALELAPKAAEEAAEEVEQKLARHNVARRIGLATPKVATDAPINLEPFRERLKQIYRNAAVEAELRLHEAILMRMEEEDDDRAAEILLLH
jgi:hypothetical protein